MLRTIHPSDHVLLLTVDVQLSSLRQARAAAHVRTCGACQARVALLRSALADAQQAYRLTEEPVTGAARLRLRRALHDAGEAWDRSWWTRWRHRFDLTPAAMGRAAAVSAAVLAVAWLVVGAGSPRRDASRPAAGGHALPLASLTPGAVSNLTAAELCAGTRAPRVVTAEVQHRVLAGYGMEQAPADRYELDALVTLELGGTVAPENLWPQPYEASLWNARVKDALERLLADEVCRGRVQLSQAQREIATDWVAAYKRRFQTETPMPHHAQSTEIDDDLELQPFHLSAPAARIDTDTASVAFSSHGPAVSRGKVSGRGTRAGV